MNSSLISIIVPVYKAKDYIDRCVESILAQTHQNLEVILVDDGSPDESPKMCDSWAEKDNRIKVLHKSNGGAASARNAGLDVASGEYIGFVDCDDYIAPDMFERLLGAIVTGGKKLSCCLIYYAYEDGRIVPDSSKMGDNVTLSVKQAVNESLYNRAGNAVWCKLHHRSVLQDIRFPTGGISEDYPVMIPSILAADGMVLVRQPLYYYCKRQSSVTGRSSIISYNNTCAVLNNLELMAQQVRENNLPQKSISYFTARVTFGMALIMEKDYNALDSEVKQQYKRYRKLMGKNGFSFIFTKYSSLKDKALYLLVLTGCLRPLYKLLKKEL